MFSEKCIAMKGKTKTIRYSLLGILLVTIWLTQALPPMGNAYARSVYPAASFLLSSFSRLAPFAVGDLFIFLSIAGLVAYPFYARLCRKQKWRKTLARCGEYLLWIYVWFYLAWGLNYSQPDFYERTGIPYTPFEEGAFETFANDYITRLNRSYTPLKSIPKELIHEECVRIYSELADSLGIRRPPSHPPKGKTMLFTPLVSKVGVTGSMAPFFNEFTLNGDLLPVGYPATYAHEFSHWLGISSEAEANFYAYQVCTRSKAAGIRFAGYFSVLRHVLRNARSVLPEEKYAALFARIRPEVLAEAEKSHAYWMEKYSPLVGNIQSRIYDLYLKGNGIGSGRRNYSEVVGLLVSYRNRK